MGTDPPPRPPTKRLTSFSSPQADVIVFSAGNNGHRPSPTSAHIGGTAAAKNCITVGATQATRNIIDAGFNATGTLGSHKSLAFFSSLGPTVEKRPKPDVVAPGLPILSAGSRMPNITAERRNAFGVTTDPEWVFMSGTSMSTPLVAGCCVILREALIETAKVDLPSAALVKALLINGAVDIGLDRDRQGFGLVNLKRALVPVENTKPRAGESSDPLVGFVDEGFVAGKKLAEDEKWMHEIDIPASAKGDVLKVTLAYSDRYGPEVQNNLSLLVQIGGTEKAGDEGFRAENTVEQVVWKDVPDGPGKVVITVTADRIARLGDAQPFAVVWAHYKEV